MGDDLFTCCIGPFALLLIFLAIRYIIKSSPKAKDKAESPPLTDQQKLAEYKQVIADSKIYEILLPPGQKWNPNVARNFTNDLLLSSDGGVIFQIVADSNRIVWRLHILDDHYAMPERIKGSYPDAEVITKDYQPPNIMTPLDRLFASYVLNDSKVYSPIKMVDDIKGDDPLVFITNHMDNLEPQTTATYSIFVFNHPL